MRRILPALTLFLLLIQTACAAATPSPSSTPAQTLAASPRPTATLAPVETATQPAAILPMLDDFETPSTSWIPGLPPGFNESSALSVALSDQHSASGTQSLELAFDKNDQPKAIFAYERPLDLSASHFLEFDIFNPGAASGVALSVSTGETWEWFESAVVPLEQGAQTISFDLTAQNYKSAASNWALTAPLNNLDHTQRIAVLIIPLEPGSVFIDTLRLSESASGTLPSAALPEPTPTPIVAVPPSFLEVKPLQFMAPAHKSIEFEIATDGVFANPFDPAEVDLKVRFTGPGGSEILAPAFWYQDYDPLTFQPRGEPGWRARLIPTAAGNWTASAELASPALQSSAVAFTVQDNPGARGFIRIHPENPRYFAFEDGSTFFPVGINMGWGAENPIADFTQWLDGLSDNGGNWIRVWMASWSFGIEWTDTGLGNYSKRLFQAWQLDQIMRLAEERGVYVELVLINHGAFSATTNPEWPSNPYNVVNGGPCQNPEDFVTDPLARDYFKRRLRYLAARWSASPSLMNWEWWNEANLTPIQNPEMSAWVQEMTPVLKENDPYGHLISTSSAAGAVYAVSQLPEIDFAQFHLYSSNDPATSFKDFYNDWSLRLKDKPILFAEFGFGAGGEDVKTGNRQGLHLHSALWTAPFVGYASTAMYWWWDSYVHPLNLWPEFAILNRFLEGEDLAAFAPVKVSTSVRNFPVHALGASDRALVWIHDRQYSANAMQGAYDKLVREGTTPQSDWVYMPEPITDLTVTFDSLSDGQYTVQWYSPISGEWLDETSLTVSGGTGTLTVPEFQGELVAKIVQP